jgi:phage protein D
MSSSNKYVAQPLVTVEGMDPQTARRLSDDLLQLVIEESLDLPAAFTLVLNNPYNPGNSQDSRELHFWLSKPDLSIGKPVEIGFSSSTTEAEPFREGSTDPSLLKAEITAIEVNFLGDYGAPVVVRGYDASHRLHRGRYNRSFQNVTDGDIVGTIAGEAGIPIGKVESGGGPYDYLFQENQTNMEFLRKRAARLGYEVYIQGGKLYFHLPSSSSSLKLEWLKDIHSFQVRATSARQVNKVEVRAWDYANKKLIVSTKRSTSKVITDTLRGKGSATSSAFAGKPTEPTMIITDQPVESPTEADKIAQAVCDELGGEYVVADAKAEGNPRIRPGGVIELEGMGPYSGKYYVTQARHLYHEGVYTTEFSVRSLRGGNLFTTLTPQTRLQPGQTLMVGIVTNNNDPEGWGRVKVKLPTLTEDHESNWARVVTMGGGANRGFDCLPEVNDEVLVGFEHGDIHRPYVLGNVWNGKDAPPEKVADSVQSGKVRLRTIKTRTGHTLQFVEEDKATSKAGLYLTTAGGHQINLNDTDRCIEIKTKGGHVFKLDDAGMNVSLTSMGSIKLQANTTIDIQATGIITVQGALIKLN